jgi:hypothetical protein
MNKEAVRRENCKTVLKMTSIRLKRLFAEDFFWINGITFHLGVLNYAHTKIQYMTNMWKLVMSCSLSIGCQHPLRMCATR